MVSCPFSALGLYGRRRLRNHRLSPAEGVEIRPNVLNSFVIESLYRRLAALRGIDFQLHLTAIRFHSVRRIHVHPFVGGIVHLYDPVLDRHGYGNPARMDWQHFLVPAKQLHGIEISNSEIIRARIVFFRPQCFLESFDRIGSDRLDREKRCGRWGTRGFCPILLEKREGCLNTHDTRHARPAFSARTEGSQPYDLARAVEQRAAGTAWVNVDIRHDGVRLDLANDASGDDLIEA